jgi:DNA helicase HerA-like ATPase
MNASDPDPPPVETPNPVERAATGDEAAPPVGRVLGTEDATPLEFWVGVDPDQYLQLDDIVVCERAVPGRDPVTLAGLVAQVRARHEGARFDSDVFLIADGVLPAEIAEAAQVLTTRVDPEIWVPPTPGSAVRRASGRERDAALSFDAMQRKLPLGLGRDGRPLYANVDFIDGTRGAHINISGISGVATKTSYATFLLYALFHGQVLGAAAQHTKALIFNVKGEDLLFLDHDNACLDDAHRTKYFALGLQPGPFRSVRVFAPARPGDVNATPEVAARTTGVHAFWWTIEEFCRDELLPFVFADAEDERNQYTMVIHNVTRQLARGTPVGDHGAWQIEGETVRTYGELVDLIERKISSDDDTDTQRAWAGPAITRGTVNAFLRRLVSSQRSLARLVFADIARGERHSIETDEAQVAIVDLHNLPDRAQRFVVGVTLRRAFDRKEAAGTRQPLQFVVLDELNKYAPRDGTSPIKEILLDIAERGRSLGIVLVGAQQTASEVERRIIGNSAIRVVGRLDPAEAARPEYGFLPVAHRQRATIAKPGTMFVTQPELPVPLVVEFPFPAWATRPDEHGGSPTDTLAAQIGDDPFDLVAGSRPTS